MFTKAKIFNLALGALLLQRQVSNADTDKSNEATVLRNHYDVAFRGTLEDLDLDSTSTQAALELVEEDPNDLWDFAYKYPNNCAFLRRLQSSVTTDNRTTHIPKRVAIHDDKKVILTNQEDAIAEFIPLDVPLNSLSATVGLCIAYRLAVLSAPLATGKGAAKLISDIEKKYVAAKADAQSQDKRENFNFEEDEVISEFVETRLS